MTDPTLRGRLANVTVPALVLWGDSDRMVDQDYGRAYAAAIPGADVRPAHGYRSRAADRDAGTAADTGLGLRDAHSRSFDRTEPEGRSASARDPVVEVDTTRPRSGVRRASSRPTRTSSGSALVPPPTMTGARMRWSSSTRPALSACPARCGPPTVRLRSSVALSRRTASGSNSGSILVRTLETSASVRRVDDLVGAFPELGEVADVAAAGPGRCPPSPR